MARRVGQEAEADPLSDTTPDHAALVALATRLHAALRQRHLTLATAESCTGGLIGHLLTEVPGSSATYLGGAITYADETKVAFAGVAPASLSTVGAVSSDVAAEMAVGIRQRLEADIGVAVTGIAGPDGGTTEKPVGLTFVALALGDEAVATHRFEWSGSRAENKLSSAVAALDLLVAAIDARSDDDERIGDGP